MRRPDLAADFESWLYDDEDDYYERQQWFVSRSRVVNNKMSITFSVRMSRRMWPGIS